MTVPGQVQDLGKIVFQPVHYESDGSLIEAYMARPVNSGHYPGVLIIHEAFGPVEHIHDLARRFANQGYIALAPNLYSRVGAPSPEDREDVFGKMFSLSDDQVVRDLEKAAAVIRGQEVSNGKVGVIGFCSGGRHALLLASSSDQVDAAIDCWGGFIRRATPTEETTESRPRPVIDLVDHLACPLFVVIGEDDQNPSPKDGEVLKNRLEEAGKDFVYKVYSGAGHAFLADYRPQYRERPAFELWDDILKFFHQHLKRTMG